MRSELRLRLFVLVSTSLLLLAVSSVAQGIRYTNFSDLSQVQLNGSAGPATWQSQPVLRLTDGASSAEAATAYFNGAQPVTSGFTTWFEFQVHHPVMSNTPGDGVAIILQNSNATDPTYGASGAGLTALGAASGGMGYAGINNNLAIEFDTFGNPWDPNSNHVAVQSCGHNTNTPVHLPGNYTIGTNHNVTSCLLSSGAINTSIRKVGALCTATGCQDGAIHQVVIEYTPPPPHQNQGTLQVWLDPIMYPGSHTPLPISAPAINVPYNVASLGLQTGGLAWVGFTASQAAGEGSTQDILAWEFTPHTPLTIVKQIPPGGTENDFIFGGYQQAVTYPSTFTNCNPTCIFMKVVATPVDRNTFYTQRLLGTQFANETCVINLETGGNCIVYSVTCQDMNGNPLTCPTDANDNIAICNGFYTSDPINANNADYLKADPIGSNNWASIFTSFQSGFDPVVGGRGRGFSDLVVTFVRNGGGHNESGAADTATRQGHLPPQSQICPALQ